VIALVRELETALAELARLSGAAPAAEAAAGEQAAQGRQDQGHGPAVPGVTQGEVAVGQQDVDALLSGLGI
jgi:chemotaxis regulatin CheY-phosphate phosphatase CheZ